MGQGRVLVVDNDCQFVRTFSTAQEREGCRVVMKQSLGGAVIYVQHHHPDILIVDFDLYGAHNGWAFVRHARRRWPNLPVVVITGDVGTKALEDAHTLVFLKPFDLETLMNYLREHV